MKLRHLYDSVAVADSVRVLREGVQNSLRQALLDLVRCLVDVKWALVGGLAVGYRSRPRGTQDIDIALVSDDVIADVVGACDSFKQIRKHALEHLSTGVEVDLVTPEFVHDRNLGVAIESAVVCDGVPVITASALVALKLNRASLQDRADIEAILKSNEVDLSPFQLTDEQRLILAQIANEHPHVSPDDSVN